MDHFQWELEENVEEQLRDRDRWQQKRCEVSDMFFFSILPMTWILGVLQQPGLLIMHVTLVQNGRVLYK